MASASPAANHWSAARTKLKAVARINFAIHHEHVLNLPFPGVSHATLCGHEDLHPAASDEGLSFHRRVALQDSKKVDVKDGQRASSFWIAAAMSLALGVASVVPYAMVLKEDPGSALFISFILHLVTVGKSLPKARDLFRNRSLPLAYHAAIILCGCGFVAFKSDANSRLPTALCLLLLNLRMLVGVSLQFLMFGQRYSSQQLGAVMTVTGGIALAGLSMQSSGSAKGGVHLQSEGALTSDFLVGVLEILGCLVSLSLLTTVMKAALSRFGETVVEEQVFMQHLFSIPLLFPCQWSKVGPRFLDWYNRGNLWLVFYLCAQIFLASWSRSAAAKMAGRSPNLLMTQLVQTLESLLQLLTVTMLRVPPWPPGGFWAGSALLLLGTVYYLCASEPPHSEQPQKDKAG